MFAADTDFQSLDLRSASEQEYRCLAEFKNSLNREYLPDDPPIPLEEQIQGWKNIPAFVENRAYAGWNSSHTKVIALADIDIENTEENQHIAYFKLEVLPEHRCQGLGRQMLRMILPFAKEHQRRLFMIWVNNRIPASAIFMERIGGRRGQEAHTNQLKISELDHSLMSLWLKRSDILGREFEMGLWDGAVPEEHLVEFAGLMGQLANDQPRDDLEIEDMKFTPEMMREVEKYFFAKGNHRWTLYLIDRATKRFVGLTQVMWNLNRPSILHQGFTAVDPAYRNQGLGRWLKAAMMKKILQERPEVEFVRTGNANSNAPMLKINHEMGFKPYISNTVWQVDLAQVEKYLNNK